ncbi:hypothetical protein FGE12_17715 [Aggregicoccus sp. 17bor-14]|uniref:hypothetical protein n=1 Tax=Myxococcaceae TaxID=31 RepID=UPI00129CF2B6|nr:MULTISPECIES: hypothetical protein [Myxococcaceae]MBF5044240.1 hypothetical protein [Simulacricoccus sp. 17bor-14]MRI89990.1 hypothetical protein [Aggregicoccus sp. 17bor-14]
MQPGDDKAPPIIPPSLKDSWTRLSALRSEWTHGLEGSRRLQARDAWLAGLLTLLGTAVACTLWLRRGTSPLIHDEWAYLLQAQMFAQGRLSWPTPPLPEFFETAHVLMVPAYMSKYFPGQAAWLAPFVRLGLPWLGPCVVLGLTTGLLFLLQRTLGISRLIAAGTACLLLASGDFLSYSLSYFSDPTAALLVVGWLISISVAPPQRSSLGMGSATALAVTAGFVRPFTGVALLATLGLMLLARPRPTWRRLAVGGVIVLLGAGGAMAFCRATTGSWTLPPWTLYARQYTPLDPPGFGAVEAPPPERALPAHLRLDTLLGASRRAHVLGKLPQIAAERFGQMLGYLPSPALLLFLLMGLLTARGALRPALIFAAGLFTLMLSFHWRDARYYQSHYPILLLLVGSGASFTAFCVRNVATARERWLAFWSMAVLPALLVLYALPVQLRQVSYWGTAWFDEQRALAEALRPLREGGGGLVFLSYPPGHSPHVDHTHNGPDIASQKVILAVDLGERDAELMALFPGKPAYRLDVGTARLTRLPPSLQRPVETAHTGGEP